MKIDFHTISTRVCGVLVATLCALPLGIAHADVDETPGPVEYDYTESASATDARRPELTGQKFVRLFQDDVYVYAYDRDNTYWTNVPNTTKKMLDVWVRLIPVEIAAQVDAIEAKGDLYTGKYYLEHYYMRKDTRQVQFVAELEVNGRPKNDIWTAKYNHSAWENLISGSIEDSIYQRLMRAMDDPGQKANTTSLRDFLEDTFRISL